MNLTPAEAESAVAKFEEAVKDLLFINTRPPSERDSVRDNYARSRLAVIVGLTLGSLKSESENMNIVFETSTGERDSFYIPRVTHVQQITKAVKERLGLNGVRTENVRSDNPAIHKFRVGRVKEKRTFSWWEEA